MNVFYGVSQLGRIVRIDIDPEYLWSIAPYSPASTKIEAFLEKSIYCRNFEALQQTVSGEDENIYDGMLEKLFPPKIEWSFGSITGVASFECELMAQRQCIPHDFQSTNFVARDIQLREYLELIKVKLHLERAIALENASDLLSIVGLIESSNRATFGLISLKLFFKIISIIYSGDGSGRITAIDLAIRLLPKYGGRLDSEGCRLVYLLLFPTVFDDRLLEMINARLDSFSYPASPVATSLSAGTQSEIDTKAFIASIYSPPFCKPTPQPNTSSGLTENKNIYRDAPSIVRDLDMSNDCKKALQNAQISVNMLLMERQLANCTSDSEKESVAFKAYTRDHQMTSISAQFHWALLLSFLGKGMLDEYFVSSVLLCQQFPTACTLGQALNLHRDTVGIAKIGYVMADAMKALRPAMVLRCLLTAVRIIKAFTRAGLKMSEPLDLLLVEQLRTMMKAFRLAEGTRFSGYSELRDALMQVNLRERSIKSLLSGDLMRELGLLKTKML